MYKYLFIIIIILIILYYYTPKIISDIGYGYLNPVKVKYIINNNNNNNNYDIIKYKFSHKYFDGDLMKLYIEKSKKNKINNKIKINGDAKDILNIYNKYQIIDIKNNKKYSSFTCAVAYIIKLIFKYRNCNIKSCKKSKELHYNECKYNTCNKLKIGIVISKRHLLEYVYVPGNYLKIGVYEIYKHNTYEEICNIHNNIIKNIKYNDTYNVNTTISDIYNAHDCDIIFNSWRNLSHIKRDDGLELIRLPEKLNKKDLINDLFTTRKKNMYVKLDYYNNKWIISYFENILSKNMGY